MKNIQVQDTYALAPLALVAPAAPVGAALPLYGTTGPATDGPMTQQATTQALLDTLSQALATASYATLPLAEAQQLGRGAAGPLQPGAFYRIEGRPATGLGRQGDILAQAVDAHTFHPTAVLLGQRPDYAAVPLWSPAYPGPVPLPVAATGTGATYTSTTEPYAALAPDASGVLDTLTGDDIAHPLTLPFAFTFGGVEYTQVAVDTNGRISFGSAGTDLGSTLSNGPYATPQAVLCGGDLYVTPGVGLVRSFCVGTAPHRLFVVDYSQVSSYGQRGDTTNYLNGQLVLEETTNRVRIGQATALASVYFSQGLQYPGQRYEARAYGTAPALGSSTIYAPVRAEVAPADDAPVPTFSPSDYACRWNGQTWWLTGVYAGHEPGTTADWSVATGPGADRYGNTVPVANGVTYDVATNTLSRRWDAAGNDVAERQDQALDAFPWECPGFELNTLRATLFEHYALHNARGTAFYNNELITSQFINCTLQNAIVSSVTFTNAQVYNWAPQTFAQNTIFGSFTADNPNLQNAFVVNNYVVQNPGPQLTQQLAGVQSSIQSSLLDNMFRTYYQGRVSYQGLDLLQPYTSDYTPHDLIVVRGVTTSPLCLRNQDYRVRGEGAVFGSGFMGAGTAPRKLTVDGVTFTNVLHVHESDNNGSGRGHDIHVLNSTIYSIGMFQGASGGYLDRHTFSNCHIGLVHREAAYNGNYGHKVCLDRCTVGRGVLPGAILGAYFRNPLSALFDSYDGSTCSLLVSNSVLYLADGMTIEPAGRHSTAPYLVFENCTVCYPDGATKNLSTSAPTYLLDTTRHAADVAALLDDAHWNTAGYGEYTGPAFAWLFPAYYEAPASASRRGYRYVLDGQGGASRYASA